MSSTWASPSTNSLRIKIRRMRLMILILAESPSKRKEKRRNSTSILVAQETRSSHRTPTINQTAITSLICWTILVVHHHNLQQLSQIIKMISFQIWVVVLLRSRMLHLLDLILASHPQANNSNSLREPLAPVPVAPIHSLHLPRISSSHQCSNRTKMHSMLPNNSSSHSSRKNLNFSLTQCLCKEIKCQINRTCLVEVAWVAAWATSLARMQARWVVAWEAVWEVAWEVAWVAAWAAAIKLLAPVSLNKTIKCRICRISNLVSKINRNLDNSSAHTSSSLAGSAVSMASVSSHNSRIWAVPVAWATNGHNSSNSKII
jgi:hypothetical protein